VFRLVRDDQILTPGYAHFDTHHRWNRIAPTCGSLIDANAARDQATIDCFEVSHPRSNLVLSPICVSNIVKGDFERYLHGTLPDWDELFLKKRERMGMVAIVGMQSTAID
jgi:hypothetical protein